MQWKQVYKVLMVVFQCIGPIKLPTVTQTSGERTLVDPNEREATVRRKRTTQTAVPSRELDMAANC
jgi:hypothetical protein